MDGEAQLAGADGQPTGEKKAAKILVFREMGNALAIQILFFEEEFAKFIAEIQERKILAAHTLPPFNFRPPPGPGRKL